MRARPRILLADDHRLILDALLVVLKGKYEIVGTAATGGETLEACRRLRPDLVLLDLSLPDRSGLEVITDLHYEMPEVLILVVTMHVDRVLADASLQSGAHGFVPKDADLAELRKAIAEVLAGRRYVSSLVPERSAGQFPPEIRFGMARLTPKQRRILQLLGEGKSTARIAAELRCSAPAVTFHRTRIRKAFGIKTEWELTRYAILIRLCEAEQDPTDWSA